MSNMTWDWSPVLQAIQGYGQQYKYKQMVDSLLGGTPGTPGTSGTPISAQLPMPQNTSLPATVNLDASMPALPAQAGTPSPLGAQASSLLPLLKSMDPSVGMPLLLKLATQEHKYSQTPQYDQNGNAFVLDDQGNMKLLDGVKARNKAEFVNGQAVDPYSTAPGTVIAPQHNYNAAFDPATGAPNAAYQKYELNKQAAGQGPAWAALAEKQKEFAASNPMLASGGGAGVSPDITSYPAGTQGMVKAMLEGRQAPPSSFALKSPYWQSLMTIANTVDPTFDQTKWGARFNANKDFSSGGKTGQLLNNGNTAINHLGHLHDQIGDVSGVQVPLIGSLINKGINAAETASGVPGVPAYNDTLGKLAQETTKFYRGTGGSVDDINRNIATLAPDLSTAQKQAGVANTVQLIYGALQPKVQQYNQTMGTNYPASHFLSKQAEATIRKMGFDPDTGEKVSAPGTGSWGNFKVHN